MVLENLFFTDTDRLNFLLRFIMIDDIGDDMYIPGICVDNEAMEERLSWGVPDENHPQRQQEAHIKTRDDDLRDVIDRAIGSWGNQNEKR